MEEITKIESIDQYDQLFGLETLHPLVNVIDFSKATKTVDYYRMNIGFYSLFLKDAKCGDLRYGRKYYDYQEGTVVCMAPGQVIGIDNRKQTPIRTKSIGLLFHPDLIRGTSLGQNIKHYNFFSYEVNEALHLSEQEREIVTDCIHKIQIELEHAIDKHSKQLIVRNIELLLDYCMRFYERQFITRNQANKDIIVKFEQLLDEYFQNQTYRRTSFCKILCGQSLPFFQLLRRPDQERNRKNGTGIYPAPDHRTCQGTDIRRQPDGQPDCV